VKQFDDVVRAFISATEDKDNKFVEGLVYSHDSAVIMTGQMTDDLEPDKVIWLSLFLFVNSYHSSLLLLFIIIIII